MATRIAITQEAQEEILGVLENYTTTINENMQSLILKFREASEETSYERLVNQTNEIIYFYNQNVRKNIYDICQDWTVSNQSIAAYCEMAYAGADAVETANDLMKSMLATIENNLIDIQEVTDVDTANLDMNDEVYDEIKQSASQCLDEINATYTSARTEAEDLESTNAMAGGLFAPIEAIKQSIIKPFDELVNNCIDSIRDQFVTINEDIKKMSGSAADDIAATTAAADTEDLIGSLLGDIM